MSSWSQRRKRVYASIVILVLLVAVGVPAFFYFYKPPSCFDNLKNGNEQGIDCGGSCQKLCASDFLPPQIAWTRFEEVAPGLYNIAAYIINPNTDGEALDVPYHMAVYDKEGITIADKTGILTLPPHRNTLAFQPAVSFGRRLPAKIFFEFTAVPGWHIKADPLSALTITSKDYSEDVSGSSLTVTIKNPSVYPVGRVAVYAILYDIDGNSLGFSKTFLDQVPAGGNAVAPFTWPIDRKGAVISIEVLLVAE